MPIAPSVDTAGARPGLRRITVHRVSTDETSHGKPQQSLQGYDAKTPRRTTMAHLTFRKPCCAHHTTLNSHRDPHPYAITATAIVTLSTVLFPISNAFAVDHSTAALNPVTNPQLAAGSISTPSQVSVTGMDPKDPPPASPKTRPAQLS